MKTESIKFELGGGSQIEANTLINILTHQQALLSIINLDYGAGKKKIDVKINAIKEGSFIIDIAIIGSAIKSLFSNSSVAYVAGIVTIFKGAWKLYSIKKGKPIADNEIEELKKHIDAKDGVDPTTIINIYNIPATRASISSTIETTIDENNVKDIKILTEGTTPLRIKRTEFDDLIYDSFEEEEGLEEIYNIEIDKEVSLGIVTCSMNPKRQWEFVYRGNSIRARIEDDEIFRLISEGEAFSLGDSIIADLEIVQKYDPKLEAYINHKYTIIGFTKHIIRATQIKLNL